MKRTLFLFLLLGLIKQTAYPQTTKIDWDIWGVPHITASNEKDLFFAQGWAEMQAHANLVLQLYGTSRGKGSAYWGQKFESSDMLIHNLNLPNIASSFTKTQNPQLKRIIRSFTDGMNAYAKAHPDVIEKDNKQVLPITPDDVNLQYLYFFVTGAELKTAASWQDIGSNAMAIAAKRSASGNAMLVENPHLPWNGWYTFFESELILNSNTVYGVNIVGLPGIGMGFNKNLGWTHTSNNLTNTDNFELTLKDGGYLLDGKKLDFKTRLDTVWIKQQNGSMLAKPLKCYSSIYGPVIKMSSKKALAVKAAGVNGINGLLEWWKMANSNNFTRFEATLKMQQIPYYNVLYADKQGNIFYLFNGLIPKRNYGTYDDWNQTIDGSYSKNIWQEYLKYDELPKLKNPVSGWLQNTNDPPWTATLPVEIDKHNYPAYIAPDEMSLRSQQSVNMLMADSKITFDHLIDDKQSTHVLLADRMLDDLLSGIDGSSSPLLQEAKQVLSKWDRKADNNSKGMLLFYVWAISFGVGNDYNYAIRWNADLPNTTPRGFRDKNHAVQQLEQAAKYVKDHFGNLSTTWGTYSRLQRNGIDLPANGAPGVLGIFRVADFEPSNGKTATVAAGDSWVAVIEFGKKVRAKVLLSYGNSSEKQSKHNGDQLKLFSEKKLRDAWFYPQDLKGHIDFTEIKKDETFINDKFKH